MSAYDNLVTNINKVKYNTVFQADKIVYEGTYSQSIAGGGTTTTVILSNPYRAKCFITLAWSIDNTNFYPAQAYTAASAPYTANGWVDADNVYIYLENFSASTVIIYVKYALDVIT